MFLRLVELDKLRLGTRKEEAKELAAKGGVDPYIMLMPASASRGGVSEKLVRVCEECREEFCSGNCIIFQYDSYQVSLSSLYTCPCQSQRSLFQEINKREWRG